MWALSWLLDLLYPPKCVFCRRLLAERETDLCGACQTELPVLLDSLKRGSSFCRCWSVYPYEGQITASLRRYKFSGMSHYADAYGRRLAMLLLRNQVAFDLLTWVPVSARRKRQRGYDQSQLLAQATARALGVPCVRTLRKIADNRPQSQQRSAAAREGNVRGVYCVTDPALVAGKRILLIDDLITTGATLNECSLTLHAAGAAQIEAATLAATVQHTCADSV